MPLLARHGMSGQRTLTYLVVHVDDGVTVELGDRAGETASDGSAGDSVERDELFRALRQDILAAARHRHLGLLDGNRADLPSSVTRRKDSLFVPAHREDIASPRLRRAITAYIDFQKRNGKAPEATFAALNRVLDVMSELGAQRGAAHSLREAVFRLAVESYYGP